MELSAEDVKHLQDELKSLREENSHLRRLLAEARERQAEGEAELIRSTYHPHHPTLGSPSPACPHCAHCRPPEKSRKQLVEQFQMWSHRLNSSFPMKKHLSDIHSEEDEQEQLPSPPPEEPAHPDPLIKHICLFGPSLEEMRAAERHQRVPHQLYFPEGEPGLEAYGNYLYPKRVGFKVVREKKKDVDIDKILFRKSFKQQDCSIFIFFQCNPDHQDTSNPLAKDINPFRTLYNIGLQFSDYVFSDQPYKHPPDRSLSLTDDRIEDIHAGQDAIVEGRPEGKGLVVPEELRRDSSEYGETCVFKSNFYLCLFTHFPFVDFFCQLLIRIIDQIKIKRMERQSEKGKNYAQLDIRCVVEELNQIIKEISPLLGKFTLHPAAKLALSFGSQSLSLNLQGNGLRENLIWDWAYRALRVFDRESLYEVYCLVMLEETVCVVCENPYLLTFAIHLLVSLLPRPFHYPYPIVSIVFEDEFLETPFTTMLGINEGSKWLEANEQLFMDKMQGKVVLNLNDQQPKIKTKRKYKLPKSEKLKRIFASFYKRAEKFDSSSRRRDVLAREVTRQENQLTAQLLNELQGFYREELLSYMPNKEIIDSIKSSIPGDNQTTVSTKLLKNIEQYIKQSRKSKEQDAMVSLLMQKQIFYVYLTQKYDIM